MYLATIDKATGNMTDIGMTGSWGGGTCVGNGLAFDTSDDLYTWNVCTGLSTLSLADGSPSNIGFGSEIGFPVVPLDGPRIPSMAADKNGNLYGIVVSGFGPGVDYFLATIDKSNGDMTYVATLPGGMQDIAFSPIPPASDISFIPEDAAHPLCPAFGACPPASQISTEYIGFGVDFSEQPGQPPVGVFADGPLTDEWGGVNAVGNLDLQTDVNGRVVWQGTTAQGLTDLIAVTAGFVSSPHDILLEVFNSDGVLIGSSIGDDGFGPDSRHLAIVNLSGDFSIASFRVSTPTSDAYGVRRIYLNTPACADDIKCLISWYYWSILDRPPESAGAEFWYTEMLRIIALGLDVKEGFIALGKEFFNSVEYITMGKSDVQYSWQGD
jgi:hypothetical protein